MADGRWRELGDGVYVRRHAELDLSTGLVVGDGRCVVVDTRGDAAQGAELAAAVRELTPLPWTVALTHAHFDHAFGTAAFLPCAVWAHPGCARALATDGETDRATWARHYRQEGRPRVAAELEATSIVTPDRLVAQRGELDLGGRRVVLEHLGPAHTDHDLVVHVPDAGVLFAGDLVEHAPGGSFTAESFGPDTVLSGWPAALDRLLALAPQVVVPGHGEPVEPAFVTTARETVAAFAQLRARVESGELDAAAARHLAPGPADVTDAALGLG
ncbi:MBL fold metallo-hydrolase [Prauserella cavernicola]|uniref:MBL fold metallo-hydrolase n=1 Tax=Prauserella cavernicola TaxID=2800127 RepID=A0A934QTY6_9PSEU|nr:MBL fold metallo-hydrolase [Prauserella cavernicola]MBK1786375.1 MBL fold metallo-hydrolase [Prauserella cavernicola]